MSDLEFEDKLRKQLESGEGLSAISLTIWISQSIPRTSALATMQLLLRAYAAIAKNALLDDLEAREEFVRRSSDYLTHILLPLPAESTTTASAAAADSELPAPIPIGARKTRDDLH